MKKIVNQYKLMEKLVNHHGYCCNTLNVAFVWPLAAVHTYSFAPRKGYFLILKLPPYLYTSMPPSPPPPRAMHPKRWGWGSMGECIINLQVVATYSTVLKIQ